MNTSDNTGIKVRIPRVIRIYNKHKSELQESIIKRKICIGIDSDLNNKRKVIKSNLCTLQFSNISKILEDAILRHEGIIYNYGIINRYTIKFEHKGKMYVLKTDRFNSKTLLNEAYVTTYLNITIPSDNFIKIYDYGTCCSYLNNYDYIVYEYIEGINFMNYCNTCNLYQLDNMIKKIFNALYIAHIYLKFVHNELRIFNIIIKNNEPVIIGFDTSHITVNNLISPVISYNSIIFKSYWQDDVNLLMKDIISKLELREDIYEIGNYRSTIYKYTNYANNSDSINEFISHVNSNSN